MAIIIEAGTQAPESVAWSNERGLGRDWRQRVWTGSSDPSLSRLGTRPGVACDNRRNRSQRKDTRSIIGSARFVNNRPHSIGLLRFASFPHSFSSSEPVLVGYVGTEPDRSWVKCAEY
jgi:hypothetical protein